MYKTVIFDLDGTLLDTLDDLTDAVNAALYAFGLPLRTKTEVCAFVGNGIVKLIERAIGYEHERFGEILEEFKGYYKAHCADKTQPYEGVLALLEALQEKGVQTAVVSNKADFAVKLLAEEYFGGLIPVALGENEAAGIRKKPAPDEVFAAMQTLGAEKATTVYVGDSEVDIQTAKNAGVDCISVTWGFRDERFLKENGAARLVNRPSEILAFCEEEK
ncbi:MAG: HAD family hydrolase [Clostridia bacterium]|nr:HAD family hydrolase [Clostridia bacterium]